MSEVLELTKPVIDFLSCEIRQSLQPKLLHIKRSHYRTENDAAAKCTFGVLACVRQRPHESAGKRVARTRGIVDILQGKGRRAEYGFSVEHQYAVFAAFDDQCFRSHRENSVGRTDEVWFIGEHTCFGVIDDKDVDVL